MDGLNRAFLVVLNFDEKPAVTDLTSVEELPSHLNVLMSTVHRNNGKSMDKSQIMTEAGEGLLIQFSSNKRFNRNHKEQCYISEKACYLRVMDILYKC